MRLGEIARVIGAAEVAASIADFAPIGYSIDSRTLRPGELFFAIRGENHDGHQFVATALEKGACAVVVANDAGLDSVVGAETERLFRVSDTLVALQTLAHAALAQWGRPLIAITGSAGKTTTKDLTARLLATKYRVMKSGGNLNNVYGLSLSVLKLISDDAPADGYELAVLEMGMNHAGEIRQLCQIARPDVGVVTNVAPVHLENFDSIEGIADAKAELIEGLNPAGLAVLNADDELVKRMRNRFSGKVMTYGIEHPADAMATEIEPVGLGQTSYRLHLRGGDARVVMPLIGQHNLYNALAAATVANYFEVTPCQIADALGAAEPSKMRGQILRFAAGFTVIDDSYNSNPRAVAAMIKSISAMTDFKRRIAVLGEMLELGPDAAQLHFETGKELMAQGIDTVVGVRHLAQEIVNGARAAGLPADQAYFCEDSAAAAKLVAGMVREGDLVLVKGSRGVKTDVVVTRLREEFPLV